jgi:glycosyltransferase involved in cell wall biosynthesis
MRNVAIVTGLSFWQPTNSGCISRVLELAKYLSETTHLFIAYLGPIGEEDARQVKALQHPMHVASVGDGTGDPGKCRELLRKFIEQHQIEVAIFEFVELSFLLDGGLPPLKTILDTHDLKYEQRKSYQAHNAPHAGHFSEEEELEVFNRFDAVMLITETDYTQVRRLIKEKAILTPHPVVMNKPLLPVREKVLNVGFVGYMNIPNFDAITWFIKNVWPQCKDQELTLNIYGEIDKLLVAKDKYQQDLAAVESQMPGFNRFFWDRAADLEITAGIVLHGYVPDIGRIYDQMDIAINPVRVGSGLKIKNVEALTYGVPLITTTHGAIGLEKYPRDAFFVADDPRDFYGTLNALIADYEQRANASRIAYAFSREQNTPGHCFKALLDTIYA